MRVLLVLACTVLRFLSFGDNRVWLSIHTCLFSIDASLKFRLTQKTVRRECTNYQRLPTIAMTAKSHANPSIESSLAFFKSFIQSPFDDDTNANIEHIWIALIYPEIEIFDGKTILTIDCRKEGFSAPKHSYSLFRFLEQLPEFCEKNHFVTP